MKKIILLLLITNCSWSQNINVFPKDESGKIHVTKIKELPKTLQSDNYDKALLFFVNSFRSSNDVIEIKDKENGLIAGKGYHSFNVRSGKYDFTINADFTIKVSVKDNKYMLEIYNIKFNKDTQAEVFFNEEAELKYSKAKKNIKIIMDDYVKGTQDIIMKIENLLDIEMNKSKSNW